MRETFFLTIHYIQVESRRNYCNAFVSNFKINPFFIIKPITKWERIKKQNKKTPGILHPSYLWIVVLQMQNTLFLFLKFQFKILDDAGCHSQIYSLEKKPFVCIKGTIDKMGHTIVSLLD